MLIDAVINYCQSMPLNILIMYTIAFIGLAVGSYTDLKTREVPDWLNFGIIGTGIGLNMLFSVIYWKWQLIINSLAGLLVFFIIAYIMFYTGQWGGGDSKILMGLGALIGIDLSFRNIPFLANFFVNALLAGAVYGLLWSFFLVFRNKKKFIKEFKKILKNKRIMEAKKWMFAFLIIVLLLMVFIKEYALRLIFLYLGLIVILIYYIWIFIKAVESSCMLKYVKPQQLTEGDWIAKDVVIDGKYITGPKDLGIEKSKIRKLVALYKKKKVNKILMKVGIPFVPSFLIAFIITIIYGNLILLFV